MTLDLIAASSTAAAMQQLAAGSANIASGGLTDPLRAIDKGAKMSLLRVEAQVPPYTLWAKPAIKSPADLRGKLIIIGGAIDITRIYLERTFDSERRQARRIRHDLRRNDGGAICGAVGRRGRCRDPGAAVQLQGARRRLLARRQRGGLCARSALHRLCGAHRVGEGAQAAAARLPHRHGEGRRLVLPGCQPERGDRYPGQGIKGQPRRCRDDLRLLPRAAHLRPQGPGRGEQRQQSHQGDAWTWGTSKARWTSAASSIPTSRRSPRR